MSPRRRPRRRLLLRTLHRWLGISAAAFLLLLCISGLALNHSAALGLDDRFLASGWLHERYGVATPGIELGFRVGEHWVSQAGGRLYLDGDAVPGMAVGRLIGAVVAAGEIVVAAEDMLVFFDRELGLLERLPLGLPSADAISRIGAAADTIWLASRDDTFRFDSGRVTVEVEPGPVPASVWSAPEVLPAALRLEIENSMRASDLSLERVLLDVHSGRLFGWSGVLVTDLAAVALVVLAVSGLLIWLRH